MAVAWASLAGLCPSIAPPSGGGGAILPAMKIRTCGGVAGLLLTLSAGCAKDKEDTGTGEAPFAFPGRDAMPPMRGPGGPP